MNRAEYVNCGAHQEPEWWSDRCEPCDHMLAVHRTVAAPEGSAEFQVMVCDMCNLAAEIINGAREFAQELKRQAVEYVDGKQGDAKDYVDGKFNAAKSYVDEQNSSQNTQVQGYVDTQNTNQNTAMQGWVNNRLVQVIKPTSFQADPRTAP